MTQDNDFLKDFHWIMDVVQHIDVGLVILDRSFTVQLWNSFMQNHSASRADEVLGKNLFSLFPELPEAWFKRKADAVFTLNNSAFTTWEQRPYLFRFKSYRPITSLAPYMYQNSMILPLKDARGNVDHICIVLYDVTEAAVNKIKTQEANLRLKHISRTDGLTGLLNRKTWENELESEFKRFARSQNSCSLVILDIDHFKKINDGYGHPAGDEVIRKTSHILKESIREIDIAGRYGGEEFVIILVDTDLAGAEVVAERLRQQIEAQIVEYDGNNITYTVSLGVAELSSNYSDKTQWLSTADQALYQSKESGRNQVTLAKTP